ncbi:TetR/AcrR family transcriptional regulator [Acinetobacter rudis]|uniref:TetR/AcrR family transcriptional regulator n=1 Tax=Acinetobacter rudis TaxID=632955 RepID=A0AAW8J815_9GAMM|nr:TetR/AcrR family transcriptional regulator [Acinetobacter rudis]MDQ8935325.1 TetR/AcrR family transcriptional regulator [Acinetobacter rudis]MDQ8952365.1 TetR/AcrR family transcriptional regulator [Acinetobacter rudis]MDQ9017588.1 TetR/AcrR family transcriptional regulator [Acinetobacter rudis]
MNQQNIYKHGQPVQVEHIFQGKKQQIRVIESDNKMVEQTIILLSDGGISSVTLEAVGVRAGYSRGLVSRHYGSKDGLFIRVFKFLEDWIEDSSKRATQDIDGIDAINAFILDISNNINLHVEKYRAYFFLWFYGLESTGEFNQYLMQVRNFREQRCLKWLKQAQKLKQLSRKSDLSMLSDFVMTSIIGLIHKWMFDMAFDIELRLKQLVNIQLRTMFANSHLFYSVNYWGE